MRYGLAIAIAIIGVTVSTAPVFAKDDHCRMEQHCHWVNFKKVCTWVKVCR